MALSLSCWLLRSIWFLKNSIRGLTLAIQNEVEQMKVQNRLLERKTDAAWELVIMTREEVKEYLVYLKKPLWKKWFGID